MTKPIEDYDKLRAKPIEDYEKLLKKPIDAEGYEKQRAVRAASIEQSFEALVERSPRTPG